MISGGSAISFQIAKLRGLWTIYYVLVSGFRFTFDGKKRFRGDPDGGLGDEPRFKITRLSCGSTKRVLPFWAKPHWCRKTAEPANADLAWGRQTVKADTIIWDDCGWSLHVLFANNETSLDKQRFELHVRFENSLSLTQTLKTIARHSLNNASTR